MRWRLNQWVLSLGMVGLCAAVAGIIWKVRCAPLSPPALAGYLPENSSVVVSINVEALRTTGILDAIAGEPGNEEPDYRLFVDMTGFDYRRHLDRVMLGFKGDHTYLLASGRYDWDAMRRYAVQAGGSCNNGFCRLMSADGGRNISFVPVRGGAIAVAAGPNQWAAWDFAPKQSNDLPNDWIDQPVLISISQDAILHGERAPDGLRPWLRMLDGAQGLAVSVSADGVAGWQMQIRIRCTRPADSARIEAALSTAINELRDGATRNGTHLDPGTLGGLLAGGSFTRTDTEVQGRWPVNVRFLETLAGGKL